MKNFLFFSIGVFFMIINVSSLVGTLVACIMLANGAV